MKAKEFAYTKNLDGEAAITVNLYKFAEEYGKICFEAGREEIPSRGKMVHKFRSFEEFLNESKGY